MKKSKKLMVSAIVLIIIGFVIFFIGSMMKHNVESLNVHGLSISDFLRSLNISDLNQYYMFAQLLFFGGIIVLVIGFVLLFIGVVFSHEKFKAKYPKMNIVQRPPAPTLSNDIPSQDEAMNIQVAPKKARSGKNRKVIVFTVILIIVLSTLSVSILVYEENRYTLIKNSYHGLQQNYTGLQNTYNSLQSNYNSLSSEYNQLQTTFYTLQNNYNNLHSSYETLYAPSTLIQNGTIHWRFHEVDGTIAEWTVPIDTYRSYIDWPEPTAVLSLSNTNTGETYTIKDLRAYVQPDFFVNVISGFTDGKIDKQFVQEVVNFKDQIVTYGSGLGDYYRWPAETITEGRGQCGDTTILMASLFKAGENRAHYGLSVYIWYCDAYHMTSPQAVNHAIVEVKYADGTDSLIETTANTFYSYNQIYGWSFQV